MNTTSALETPRPPLLLVCGPPASGKSTLAAQVARELGLYCLSRDYITDCLLSSLADPFSLRTFADTRPVSEASFRLFYLLIEQMVDAALGLVAETNFLHGPSEPNLLPLVARTRMIQLYCEIAQPLSVERYRYRARAHGGSRNALFFEEERVRQIDAGVDLDSWRLAVPLNLDVPLIRIDTTQGYTPELRDVVKHCAELLSTSSRFREVSSRRVLSPAEAC